MERETHRRLPEVRAAQGLLPVESSVPPLNEQGDYCASRGMDYLADFWANLTREERVSVGGKATLDAWKKLARAAVAAPRSTKAPILARPSWWPLPHPSVPTHSFASCFDDGHGLSGPAM